MVDQPQQWLGTGRRKSATARVYLRPNHEGKGKVIINGRSFEDYFPRATARMDICSPFNLTNQVDQFNVIVNYRLMIL